MRQKKSGDDRKQGNLSSVSGKPETVTRKGSAVVLLCILFITLTGALAIIYEASDRKAAVSLGEAAFDNAGRSVLACYDRELFERYGMFAFEGDEEKTEQRLEKIAKASIEHTRIGRCRVHDVDAEQSAYCLADPDNLMIQVREISKRSFAVDVLESLKDDLRTAGESVRDKDREKDKIRELEQEREQAKQQAAEAVEASKAAEENEGGREEAFLESDASVELEDIKKAEKLQNDLKERARSIQDEPGSYHGGRVLRNGRISDSLPSVSAGCREGSAFTGGTVLRDLSQDGAENAAGDDLATLAYIEHYFRCEHDADSADRSFFRGETEYILYGCPSDEENYRKAYHSIFTVRTAVNTVYLYTDGEKSSLILAAAESMTPGPFAPLTQLLLTTLWAAAEAGNDMKNLEDGRGVPMLKSSISWMTDLDSVVNGASGGETYIPIPGDSQMTYSRYLDLLLLTLERDTKMYRMMDLIQINLKGTVRGDFTMADHYTGFALKAEIRKKSHAVGVMNSSAEINMTHTYLTGA